MGVRKTKEEAAAIVQMRDRGDLNQRQQQRRKTGFKGETGGRMGSAGGLLDGEGGEAGREEGGVKVTEANGTEGD